MWPYKVQGCFWRNGVYAGLMGRPKSDDPKSESIHVRLRPEQIAAFDKLVERRAEQLKGMGAEVSRTTVLRSLVEKALEEEGLSPGVATEQKGAKKTAKR